MSDGTDQEDGAPVSPSPAGRSRRASSVCGKDPAMGPGSCLYWWEGCSRAEWRGCALLAARSGRAVGHQT